ncbi:hypothetical protein SAMN04488548_136792 [Gordonia westfalica]|uniref:Uncharacterized protein n=1 Tax=Gordonia westfalica TaxID=158898 RepID=A0A1H2LSZ0_9ACTN|nr:hypothetical protein SAMN04488548_136792 [Gordonia westfalica]
MGQPLSGRTVSIRPHIASAPGFINSSVHSAAAGRQSAIRSDQTGWLLLGVERRFMFHMWVPLHARR